MSDTKNSATSPEPREIDPNRLLDALIAKMRLESDAALANKLQVIQPIVRMLREGKLTMSTPVLLSWLHEATGIPVEELRAWGEC